MARGPVRDGLVNRLMGTQTSRTQAPPRTADAELLERWVGRGDRNAGSELLLRYFDRLRRYFAGKVARTDVEDLVQRTFAGCVEGIPRFRAEASFNTYIFSIARRQLFRHYRDAARDSRRNNLDAAISTIEALDNSAGSTMARREIGDLVRVALESLPSDAQTLLELHYWEELPGPEIAGMLGIRPGTVRTRLHRARSALRTVLVKCTGHTSTRSGLDSTARALGSWM